MHVVMQFFVNYLICLCMLLFVLKFVLPEGSWDISVSHGRTAGGIVFIGLHIQFLSNCLFSNIYPHLPYVVFYFLSYFKCRQSFPSLDIVGRPVVVLD